MKRKKTGRLNDEGSQHRYGTYSSHYVCFSCRKMFNQLYWGHWNDWRGAWNAPAKKAYPCPECKAEMQNVGKDFKPPRQQNIKQWRKVELLFQRGYRWKQAWELQKTTETPWRGGSNYVTVGSGPQARTLREAKDYPPRI